MLTPVLTASHLLDPREQSLRSAADTTIPGSARRATVRPTRKALACRIEDRHQILGTREDEHIGLVAVTVLREPDDQFCA